MQGAMIDAMNDLEQEICACGMWQRFKCFLQASEVPLHRLVLHGRQGGDCREGRDEVREHICEVIRGRERESEATTTEMRTQCLQKVWASG